MKLDHDKIRVLLLAIESSSNIHGLGEPEGMKFATDHGINRDELAYMIIKLSEGGLITGKVRWSSGEPYWINPGNLTFQGHEYLDNIRDNKVWSAVKKATTGLASVSLAVAVEVGKAEVRRRIGLPPG